MAARDIIALCQKHLPAFGNDCSGLLKAVTDECGVLLTGNANYIIDYIDSRWSFVADGFEARKAAARGLLVVAGARARGHGHVVIVVDGPMSTGHSHRYPYCFWGSYKSLRVLGKECNIGFSRGHGCLNYAFGEESRDKVIYRSVQPLSLMLPRAPESQGFLIHTFT